MILPESDDLVDGLDRGKTLALAFPNLLGVAAALSNYSEHNNRLACEHVLLRRECAWACELAQESVERHMRGCRTEIVDVEHVYGSLGATKLFKARPGIGSI